MPCPELQLGRLADDRDLGPAKALADSGDQAGCPQAADLLVIGEGEMQRCLQPRFSISAPAPDRAR